MADDAVALALDVLRKAGYTDRIVGRVQNVEPWTTQKRHVIEGPWRTDMTEEVSRG